MSDHSYNGWSNFETWCVNVWLSNDEPTYRAMLELVGDNSTDGETDLYRLAEAIKDYTCELPEAVEVLERVTLVSDLFQGALSEVDWHELAQSWAYSYAEAQV